MHSRTSEGRAIRILTIIDEYTRECLAIDAGRRLNSDDVMLCLEQLFVELGTPVPDVNYKPPSTSIRSVHGRPDHRLAFDGALDRFRFLASCSR